MGKIIITIEVPDGVTPSVDYAQTAAPVQTPQNAPQAPQEEPPPPWSGWEQKGQQEPPSAPTAKPECPDHPGRSKNKGKGWYCPTPIEKDANDNVTKWCPWRP